LKEKTNNFTVPLGFFQALITPSKNILTIIPQPWRHTTKSSNPKVPKFFKIESRRLCFFRGFEQLSNSIGRQFWQILGHNCGFAALKKFSWLKVFLIFVHLRAIYMMKQTSVHMKFSKMKYHEKANSLPFRQVPHPTRDALGTKQNSRDTFNARYGMVWFNHAFLWLK